MSPPLFLCLKQLHEPDCISIGLTDLISIYGSLLNNTGHLYNCLSGSGALIALSLSTATTLLLSLWISASIHKHFWKLNYFTPHKTCTVTADRSKRVWLFHIKLNSLATRSMSVNLYLFHMRRFLLSNLNWIILVGGFVTSAGEVKPTPHWAYCTFHSSCCSHLLLCGKVALQLRLWGEGNDPNIHNTQLPCMWENVKTTLLF